MKIFLDDKREFPDPKYQYNSTRDYDDCISLIRAFRNDIEIISLDYNLGCEHTGTDVLIFMKENGIVPQQINIHSDNIFGIPEMVEYARKNFPDTKITRTQW